MIKILLVIGLALSFANASLINKCKNYQAISSFDANKFSGLWYVYGYIGLPEVPQCARTLFTFTSTNNTMHETTKALDNYGRLQVIDANLGLGLNGVGEFVTSVPATWYQKLFGRAEIIIRSKILRTDYTSFAFVQYCNDQNAFMSHDEFYIITKNTTRIQSSSLAEIQNTYGINLNHLRYIDHSLVKCNGL